MIAADNGSLLLGIIIGMQHCKDIGMVIGIAAILTPLAIKRKQIRVIVPIMIGFSVLLVILSLDGELDTYDGIILIGLLIAFTIFTYKNTISQARKPHPKTETKLEKKSLAKLALGVALLYADPFLPWIISWILPIPLASLKRL